MEDNSSDNGGADALDEARADDDEAPADDELDPEAPAWSTALTRRRNEISRSPLDSSC